MSNPNDLFWLASYAFNTINPMVDEVKAIEPSAQLGLDLTFGHAEAVHTKAPKVSVAIHWSRDGMFDLSFSMSNKTEVDIFAAKVRGKVDKLILADAAEERRIDAALNTISV